MLEWNRKIKVGVEIGKKGETANKCSTPGRRSDNIKWPFRIHFHFPLPLAGSPGPVSCTRKITHFLIIRWSRSLRLLEEHLVHLLNRLFLEEMPLLFTRAAHKNNWDMQGNIIYIINSFSRNVFLLLSRAASLLHSLRSTSHNLIPLHTHLPDENKHEKD